MPHVTLVSLFSRCVGAGTLAAALLLGGLPGMAGAQGFPSKPVRFIVPSVAGGGMDNLTRVLAGKLSVTWNQPVVVENKPGASFIIGTDFVAKAAADGHTLLLVPATALTVNPIVIADLPYNPSRDLVPVMVLSTSPFLLLVNSKVAANSAGELLSLLRANPGKYNLGFTGATLRLASELFRSLADVSYADVNYKSALQAATSTAAGEIEMSLVDVASATPLLQSGRVRVLAVTTERRFKLRPDIPSLTESGVPGYSSGGLTVLAAPSRTPVEIIARINADLARSLALPEVVQSFEALGNEVLASSVADAAKILGADAEKWAKLAKERGVRFQ